MSDYHPHLDGPAEPIGLAMDENGNLTLSSLASAQCSAEGVKCKWWINYAMRCEEPATVEAKSTDTGNKWNLCQLHSECIWGSGWVKTSLPQND